MMQNRDQNPQLSRQARIIAVVISGTVLLWMLLQLLGAEYGWQPRFVFLFDFMALGALAWALITTWLLWRKRRND